MSDIEHERQLESHEIRDLAVKGVAALGLRTLIIRLMGLAVNLVLARLLTPHDFGLAAFGLTVVSVGAFLTDGGLGATLLRLTEVRRRQLEAFLGAQLVLAIATAAVIVALGTQLGTAGGVAAVMALSLPFDAIKGPAGLTCERRLNYAPIVRAEVAEMLAYNVIAVSLVVAGAGIWGLAVAAPCRALVGAIVLTQQSGARIRPRLLWDEVRPLYSFGVKLQGVTFLAFVRDQGLNIATTAIAGFAALGTLSLAQRLMQPIWLVFEGSWRVSFPAMSRLRDAGRDVAEISVRTLGLAATTTGFAVVAVSSSVPALVPSLFGDKWAGTIPVAPILLATLLIGGPMLACASGFFATIGRPGRVLRAEIAGTVVAFAVALPLLGPYGARGLAIGTFAATAVADVVLVHDLRAYGVHAGRVLLRSTAISAVSATAGWLVADELPATLWAAVTGALVGSALYVLLAWALERETVRDAINLARRALPQRAAPAGA